MSSELSSIRLPVEGMSCAACANRIEKRLSKLNGVESVHVHLGMDEAHIVYDPKQVRLPEMEKIIQDLGYRVPKEEVDMEITGMTCAACASRIEKVLNRIPEVANASVNLATESARVAYYPGTLAVSDVVQRVERLGYGAKPKSAESGKRKEEEWEKKESGFLRLWHFPFRFCGPWPPISLFFIGSRFRLFS